MDEVFLLWHVHGTGNGGEDAKLIGAYRTRGDAEEAIQRVGSQAGFRDTPQGFEISPYRLNEDHWTEGYIGVAGVD